MSDLNVPPQITLHRLFSYDATTGVLTWRNRPRSDFTTQRSHSVWNSRFSGKSAGGPKANGYIQVMLNGVNYLAHRLIWTLAHSDIPPQMRIDHLDGDPANNRLSNLRLVTDSENSRNHKLSINNTSGKTGVYWQNHTQKWCAASWVNGDRRYLGIYSELSDASAAIDKFYRNNGFTERHIRGAHHEQ